MSGGIYEMRGARVNQFINQTIGPSSTVQKRSRDLRLALGPVWNLRGASTRVPPLAKIFYKWQLISRVRRVRNWLRRRRKNCHHRGSSAGVQHPRSVAIFAAAVTLNNSALHSIVLKKSCVKGSIRNEERNHISLLCLQGNIIEHNTGKWNFLSTRSWRRA